MRSWCAFLEPGRPAARQQALDTEAIKTPATKTRRACMVDTEVAGDDWQRASGCPGCEYAFENVSRVMARFGGVTVNVKFCEQ
jgi:hypothetical protein